MRSTRKTSTRQELLSALSAHVLAHGLSSATLRPMAAAAGTSDRMLIYHFGSKEQLIGEILDHLAVELAAGLDAALPSQVFESDYAFFGAVLGLMRSQAFRPYIAVWFDIVSAAAHGGEAYRSSGKRIIDIFHEWVAARHPRGAAGATLALAVIEGILVIDAVDQTPTADDALANFLRMQPA